MNKFASSIRALLLFTAFFCCISTLSVFGQRDQRTKQQTIDYLNKTLAENFAANDRRTFQVIVDDKSIRRDGHNCDYGKNTASPITSIFREESENYWGDSTTNVYVKCRDTANPLSIILLGNYRDEADNIINAIKHLMALEDGSISIPTPSPTPSASPTPTPKAPVSGAIIISDEAQRKDAARLKEQELDIARQAAKRAYDAAKARAAQTKPAAKRPRKAAKGTVTAQ
jgi:hypothetical protein